MKLPLPPRRTVLAIFATVFAIEFAALSIAPVDRPTWLIENVLVVVAVAVLARTRLSFPLSRLSYTLIFFFLALHEVGAHYSYSLVPYEEWTRSLFGVSLNEVFGFERNHFDRAIHFLYGLCLVYPVREFYVRVVDARGVWGYVLPTGFVMSTSMLYELIEWLVAVVFGGDLGQSYLGTQGDVWDAHWDMALATLGALIAMLATLAVNASLKRDFAREFAESLTVKDERPLGEEALAEMLDDDS